MRPISPDEIDALLPQTQCGLCGYGGCMPYAEAIVFENAPIHLCPPGGVSTLKALGELLQQDVATYVPEMEQKTKPKMQAVIREAECIGCTKCIQVCPVDAIVGSIKQMHTVIASECTGCELCIPACPVDCIDMTMLGGEESLKNEKSKADYARKRFQDRQARLAREDALKKAALEKRSLMNRKHYIHEAIARVKAKKIGITVNRIKNSK